MKSNTISAELKKKIQDWLISFHQLDPRYKILTFFNQVASEGADNLILGDEDDEFNPSFCGWGDDPLPVRLKFTHIHKLLQDAFNTTSILTVWRPCSNDAMRKMMKGAGVGKGLDIKGKSAQKGELSAFVPFMQIHDNADKKLVQPIGLHAKMRVYYHSAEARETAMETLKLCTREGVENQERDMIPGAMKLLDGYNAKGYFGVELAMRLFWKAYVENQDITRGEDTMTGRPSTPGFQDANNYSLASAMKTIPKPSPMPVVVQYNQGNALSPQHLVMAYEENGTVTPVVSDFDGFLLGWRREALWFGCNLPREQEDLMMWCVDRIEEILDGERNTDTWTVRWLDILKAAKMKGFQPEIPEYGFGDPKCYSIMESAALRLIDTGAVRHGAECFNYYFPQEIDDVFLLISDTLDPVPWKYVNVKELQEILSDRIADGFVFPLNPKWILCDPGWKKLYDELMASEALYADLSKDVWFPPHTGIRKRIDQIYKKHPKGFQRQRGRVSFIAEHGYSPLRRNCFMGQALTGTAAYDLADLELQQFHTTQGHKSTLAEQIRASMEDIPEDSFSTTHHSDDEDITGKYRRHMFLEQLGATMENSQTESESDCQLRASSDSNGLRTSDLTVDEMRESYASRKDGRKEEVRRHFMDILAPSEE